MSPSSFSSFSSFTSFPVPEAEPSRPSSEKNRPKSKHKSRKDKERERDVSPEQSHVEEPRNWEPERGLFFTDRRGDPLNVRYGGLHTGDIPKHSLVDRGKHVLGLPPAWKVLHRGGKGIEIGLAYYKSRDRGISDSSTRKLLEMAPKRNLVDQRPYKYEEMDGYLRLPSRRQKKDARATYRSISLPEQESDYDTSELDADSDNSDGSMDLPLSAQQLTLRRLEEDLAANPSLVSTWLSLLSHTLSSIPVLSKNASAARAEITLSVLRRALNAHPSNASSCELRLRYLAAGENIWHESKIRSEWEQALQQVQAGDIWLEWLEWRLRSTSLAVDGIVQDGVRCLNGLRQERDKLRCMWRVAVALDNAGHVERAFAVFQAQAELTFHPPETFQTAEMAVQLDSLEEFWESEVPRIGEAHAKGWSAWISDQCPELDHTLLSPSTKPPLPPADDPFVQWASQESLYDANFRLPTRSVGEAADEDPYSTVLFSDVRVLLFPITSEKVKHDFRLVWLSFIGLNIPGLLTLGDEQTIDDRWANRHFARRGYQEHLLPKSESRGHLTSESHAGVIVGREKKYSSAFGPVKSWAFGVLEPLDICQLDGQSRLWYWDKEDVTDVNQDLVRRVFSQLRIDGQDYEWDQMALAFEAVLNAKSALKTSRQLLAQFQTSARYWGYHAKLERLRGPDGARKVYGTVLGPSSPCLNDPYSLHLWWDWAELEWLSGDSDKAQSIALQSVSIHGHGGSAILRGRRVLDDKIAHDFNRREVWIKLKALVVLITSSSLKNALSVFDDNMPSGPVEHERLTMASLALVYHHTRLLKNASSPAILRQRARDALQRYPQNTLVLGMFLESEKGQAIWGRVRTLFSEGDGDLEKGVLRRVQELWLGVREGSLHVERTRSALETAVLLPRTKTSPILWRLYILFEVRSGQLQKAKNLIYRAIKMAPMNKGTYLLAFNAARAAFTRAELMTFAESMAERGIRTRRGLEEMVNGAPMVVDESEASENEFEHDAAEFRRLRPY